MAKLVVSCFLAAWAVGCGGRDARPDRDEDAGAMDAGMPDGGGPDDAGSGPDAGPPSTDAGPSDGGTADAGPLDAGRPDSGPPDSGLPDSGPPDAGPPDAGPPDAGPPDSGPACVDGTTFCERSYILHECVGGVDRTTTCPMVCGGTPPACRTCIPDSISCVSDDLLRCRPDGSGRDLLRHCSTGCTFSRCRILEPVNVATSACTTASTTDLTFATPSASFDTTTCPGGSVIAQVAPGPAVMACVVIVRTFTVAAGTTLRVSGAHPWIVVATELIQIDGTLDASADGVFVPGNGEVTTGAGSGGSTAGGGGAGYATAGGAGGSTPTAMGSPGGPAYGTDRISPIVGGSWGAGRGGGAVQLSSCDVLRVGATAIIDAGGGGGAPGGCTIACRAGGGGGSGGTIILEAGDLQLAAGARITANGGSGGCGSGDGTASGTGADGPRALMPATPSCPDAMLPGGLGGYGDRYNASHAPTAGGDATGAAYAGGGGGAAGRIRYGEHVFSGTGAGVIYSPYPDVVGPSTR